MYLYFKNLYDICIRGNSGALAEFWGNIEKSDPRIASFPILREPGFESNTYPLLLHGDGVPCTKKGSLDCLTFESLPGRFSSGLARATRDIIFMITGCMS